MGARAQYIICKVVGGLCVAREIRHPFLLLPSRLLGSWNREKNLSSLVSVSKKRKQISVRQKTPSKPPCPCPHHGADCGPLSPSAEFLRFLYQSPLRLAAPINLSTKESGFGRCDQGRFCLSKVRRKESGKTFWPEPARPDICFIQALSLTRTPSYLSPHFFPTRILQHCWQRMVPCQSFVVISSSKQRLNDNP